MVIDSRRPRCHLASVAHGLLHMPNFHPQTREEYLAQELAVGDQRGRGKPGDAAVAVADHDAGGGRGGVRVGGERPDLVLELVRQPLVVVVAERQ